LLPGGLPPDQLIFEHLYNLPPDDDFWENNLQFSRDVFTNSAGREAIRELGISGNAVDLKERLAAYTGNKKTRAIFKDFYNSADFQLLVATSVKPLNAWRHWVEKNPKATNDFLESFKAALFGVMKDGYAVDDAKLAALEVKLKKVPNVLK
jgi:predicted YcjX-like family ATPase